MEYRDFVRSKKFKLIEHGFELPRKDLNRKLFGFQKVIVQWALRIGRAAIFADTGLGKTAMQCEWARHICKQTGGNCLIVAPLCVSQQTVQEARKFSIDVKYCRSQEQVQPDITVTNYEMVDHFDLSQFKAIVLDESSILKHQGSKTRKKLIELCRAIPYRLSCTATPSPNDHMELCNQAEFLGIMKASEVLAMFFVHDGGETSKWRLKGHGKVKFWEWMSTWAICMRKPSDLGFNDDGYILPALKFIEHQVKDNINFDDELIPREALTLNERRLAKKLTISDRVDKIADIINNSNEQWIVWCHLNAESSALASAIHDAVEVSGSDKIEDKEHRMLGFTCGEYRVLVTKPSIAGFGMNWQHCHNMAFVGLSDSFEAYYQAIRRCWRFGQEHDVNVYIITARSEGAIKRNLERKEAQMAEMSQQMVEHMKDLTQKQIKKKLDCDISYNAHKETGNKWIMYLGDCVEALQNNVKDNSIGYSIFSPPFASLYTYTNNEFDMGNANNDGDFYQQFKYLLPELYRVTMPGRLLSFHCMNYPTMKQREGFIGLRDFRGELIRLFIDAGFIYHSEVVIWKDPVTAMQRTKALGLLWKQLKKDASQCRQGIPDYLVTMRKPGDNPDPVSNTAEEFPVELWQQYASPVWMDINQSETLTRTDARENDDERHICPLQLEVIRRALKLWTKQGDLVLSPFAGIGSEGHVALKMGRKFIGVELKESYYNVAVRNLDAATKQQELF